MPQHFRESHDRKLFSARPGIASGGNHLRARYTKTLKVRHARAQRVNQRRPQLIPGSLARHETDTQRGTGGALAGRAVHLTRLRVEVPMKSTNSRTSGCDSASTCRRSTASASFRSD